MEIQQDRTRVKKELVGELLHVRALWRLAG